MENLTQVQNSLVLTQGLSQTQEMSEVIVVPATTTPDAEHEHMYPILEAQESIGLEQIGTAIVPSLPTKPIIFTAAYSNQDGPINSIMKAQKNPFNITDPKPQTAAKTQTDPKELIDLETTLYPKITPMRPGNKAPSISDVD